MVIVITEPPSSITTPTYNVWLKNERRQRHEARSTFISKIIYDKKFKKFTSLSLIPTTFWPLTSSSWWSIRRPFLQETENEINIWWKLIYHGKPSWISGAGCFLSVPSNLPYQKKTIIGRQPERLFQDILNLNFFCWLNNIFLFYSENDEEQLKCRKNCKCCPSRSLNVSL